MLPSFAVIPATGLLPGFVQVPGLDLDWVNLLHGEQAVDLADTRRVQGARDLLDERRTRLSGLGTTRAYNDHAAADGSPRSEPGVHGGRQHRYPVVLSVCLPGAALLPPG